MLGRLFAAALISFAIAGCSVVPNRLQLFGSNSAAADTSKDDAIRKAAIADSNFPSANQPSTKSAP